jgi:hypothetical protein
VLHKLHKVVNKIQIPIEYMDGPISDITRFNDSSSFDNIVKVINEADI